MQLEKKKITVSQLISSFVLAVIELQVEINFHQMQQIKRKCIVRR